MNHTVFQFGFDLFFKGEDWDCATAATIQNKVSPNCASRFCRKKSKNMIEIKGYALH
jgi:hypothetical protein